MHRIDNGSVVFFFVLNQIRNVALVQSLVYSGAGSDASDSISKAARLTYTRLNAPHRGVALGCSDLNQLMF